MIHVNIDGIGDIRDVVKFSESEVETAAQGVASSGRLVLRDLGPTTSEFPVGRKVTIDLDGHPRLYSGFIQRTTRSHWFSVDKPTTTNRRWILTVVDNNILFHRRVVHKVSDPADIEGPQYPPGTADIDVIADLTSDWLSALDDYDLSSLVESVGDINLDQISYPWNGGQSWAQAMTTIAALPAAIFYLNPDDKLVYTDATSEDVDAVLTDWPANFNPVDWAPAPIFGYREGTYWRHGTELVNDMFGWGFGKGRAQGVFSRLEDTDSIDSYGRWQDAVVKYDVWKQATIDRVVDSVVNGSPLSLRGHKEYREVFECVIHEHGLRVGDLAYMQLSAFGNSAVLPVRKIKMKFPTPDDVRYELTLSHAYDSPWGFLDPFAFVPIVYQIPEIPDINPVLDCWTDRFNRTVATNSDTLGTADVGEVWLADVTGQAGENYTVDGDWGIFNNGQSDGGITDIRLPLDGGSFTSASWVGLDNSFAGADSHNLWSFSIFGAGITFSYTMHPDELLNLSMICGDDSAADEVESPVALGSPFAVYLLFGGGFLRLWVWDPDDPQPEDPTIELDVGGFGCDPVVTGFAVQSSSNSGGGAFETRMNDLTIAGACSFIPSGGVASIAGEYCEIATRVNASRYRVVGDMMAGSAVVKVNGLTQRLGDDFTQDDDPLTDIIFSGSISVSDTVYVCYIGI